MNCFVKFVGVLDKSGSTHYVEFVQGLNVITGKSSTGKSAIIEIFDYCFGSSDYTIPEGIITAQSEIYFTVLQFPSMALVLARRGESDSCFIKELTNIEDIEGLKETSVDFFSKTYFMPLNNFKKELGRYFNVTLTDVDEDTASRGYLGRKSPTPSVRSFTSFMLQHQNLVANKHAIFFRFDEKEKREQTIDHFKVFLGIADQEYFMLAQSLNEKKQELRKIEIALPKKADEKIKAQEQITRALDEYSAISGTSLMAMEVSSIAANPQRALDAISNTPVQVNALSSIFEQQRAVLEQVRSTTTSAAATEICYASLDSICRKLQAIGCCN
jgi:AAA domain